MDLNELAERMTAIANDFPTEIPESQRLALVDACQKIHGAIESPLESLLRFTLGVHQAAAVRLGVDLKLFDIAIASQGPVSVQVLAAESSADPQLVGRLIRMLAGMNLFEEVGQEVYQIKPLGAAYISASPLSAAVIHLTSHASAVALLPDYFAAKGYQNPNDAFDGPWQFAQKTNEHYFEWVSKRPRLHEAFNVVMAISRQDRGEEWFDFYPVEEKLHVHSSDEVLLIDVGGGLGHDLTAFRKRFPNTQGRLILEDLPNVISNAKHLPEGIKTLGHNFFDPQPSALKDAKAFYLRTVLHDWPDEQARTILERIRASMSKDSILLINENAIPESNASLYAAQLDINMMTCFSSLDRTEKQFAQLLNSSGFELMKVWKPQVVLPGSAVLFEAVLK